MVSVTISISDKINNVIYNKALEEDRSKSSIINEILKKYFDGELLLIERANLANLRRLAKEGNKSEAQIVNDLLNKNLKTNS
ncbi:hypothetical protein LCGC14_0703040 [marine sediment metagenome]|uniref:Ribbon-helix-helix protein CopG domain-containing protein n=1 Tax=marine sediment metagenome TaxID=412755 RepID=A0A0F9T356_9ZZZZ